MFAPGVGKLGVLKLLVIIGELRNKSFHYSNWCYFCYLYGWFENDELLCMIPGVNGNIPGENDYPKLNAKLNWLSFSLSWPWPWLYSFYFIFLFYLMLLLVYFFRRFNLLNDCVLFYYFILYFFYTYFLSCISLVLSLLSRYVSLDISKLVLHRINFLDNFDNFLPIITFYKFW